MLLSLGMVWHQCEGVSFEVPIIKLNIIFFHMHTLKVTNMCSYTHTRKKKKEACINQNKYKKSMKEKNKKKCRHIKGHIR